MRRSLARALLAATALLATGAAHAEDTVPIACVIELSGSGATVGTLWRDAVHMAADDINAKGGLLGHKIVVTDYDTQTNPSVSRAVLQKALDGHPYAVLGPIYSGSVKVDEPLTQAAGIVQITGAEASDITRLGDPDIFRTSFSQLNSMPRVARYMATDLHAKKIAVLWVNDDFGRGGHDAFVAAAQANGMEVVADLSSEAGQASFTADVLKARRARPDAMFVYLHEEESARFLKDARSLGLKMPLVGETTLMNAQTIKLAGDAANGVIGHVGLTADAPIPAVQDFVHRFKDQFHITPDHNAIKAYVGVYMVKAATEKMGKLDAAGLAAAMHGLSITPAQEPGILMATSIDDKGDIDRESFLVEVQDGQTKVVKVLPKLAP